MFTSVDDQAIEASDYRTANSRAEYIYGISNVGALGPNIVKIMTRRLEPRDRVRELGDASVPFLYDIVFDRTLEAAGATEGDCPDVAPARGTWDYEGGKGLVGCFLNANGSAQVVWTDADAGVISFAIGRRSQSVEDLFSWWASLPVLVPAA